MKKKEILILAHYYYPDIVSTAIIIQDLAEGLRDSFDMSILCINTNNYKEYEEIEGVKVNRINTFKLNKESKINRILNILLYFIKAIIFVIKNKKPDVVIALSQPPVFGGLLGLIIKKIKKSKLIYYVQDINPEQTKVINYFKNNFLFKALTDIDKNTCKKADAIVTIDPNMANTLNKRFNKPLNNIFIIPNWIDNQKIYPLTKNDTKVKNYIKQNNLEDKYIIMYSGNIGLFYDLENIIKVMAEFKDEKDIAFVFIGEGAMLNRLKKYKNDNKLENIYFIPFSKKEELNISLNVADIHLCTNASGINGISCPSKFYGIAAINKPVICIMDKESIFTKLVEENNWGYSASPKDYETIKKIFIDVIKNKPKEVNSRDYFINGKQTSINRYKELLEQNI